MTRSESQLRASNPLIADIQPYDPKYLPAPIMLSANETTADVPLDVRSNIDMNILQMAFNRYPDPLANDLRDAIAEWHGVKRENVMCGNGGDELLFNLALAWGGEAGALLTMPPTFSVYAANARLTNTKIVEVPRLADFSVDEEAVIARASQGDIGMVVLTNPNNPTGTLASRSFIERLLDATDALVLLDEAYIEFAYEHSSSLPLLADHENLVILRTFSKAYRLAGVRMGYVLANTRVITELMKVRQPYSVDSVSQTIALEVVRNRDDFGAGIEFAKAERDRMAARLNALPGVTVYPSAANFVLVQFDRDAGQLWQQLYDQGILVRDFSTNPLTPNCLRISVGSTAENEQVVKALRKIFLPEADEDRPIGCGAFNITIDDSLLKGNNG